MKIEGSDARRARGQTTRVSMVQRRRIPGRTRAFLRALTSTDGVVLITWGLLGGAFALYWALMGAMPHRVAAGIALAAGAAGMYAMGHRMITGALERLAAAHPDSSVVEWGRVVVGVDGLSWNEVEGHRFERWDAVGRAKVHRGRAHVELADGVVVIEVDDAAELVAAIERARREWSTRDRVDVPGALHLATDDLAAWVERLRALARPDATADYGRAAGAMPLELLVRVAEDPSVEARVRVASALALSSASDRARARVRVAIDQMADHDLADEMREALEGRVLQEQRKTR